MLPITNPAWLSELLSRLPSQWLTSEIVRVCHCRGMSNNHRFDEFAKHEPPAVSPTSSKAKAVLGAINAPNRRPLELDGARI